MIKGLDAFKRIKSYFNPKQLLTKEKTLNDLDTIEKELKALEIIKEKQIAVDEFIRCCKKDNSLEEYNNFAGDDNSLTQEEYDIVKEVLYEKETS